MFDYDGVNSGGGGGGKLVEKLSKIEKLSKSLKSLKGLKNLQRPSVWKNVYQSTNPPSIGYKELELLLELWQFFLGLFLFGPETSLCTKVFICAANFFLLLFQLWDTSWTLRHQDNSRTRYAHHAYILRKKTSQPTIKTEVLDGLRGCRELWNTNWHRKNSRTCCQEILAVAATKTTWADCLCLPIDRTRAMIRPSSSSTDLRRWYIPSRHKYRLMHFDFPSRLSMTEIQS